MSFKKSLVLLSPPNNVSAPSGVVSVSVEFHVFLLISFHFFPTKFPKPLSVSLES